MKRNSEKTFDSSTGSGVRVISCDFVDRIFLACPNSFSKTRFIQIIGAAMDVYYRLGRGFSEPVYQEAFEIELGLRGIPFKPQCEIKIYYKGQALSKFYKPDVICFGQIITALKVCDRLTGLEESQILNYLKATQKHVGLLINFGSAVRLEWKRYVL